MQRLRSMQTVHERKETNKVAPKWTSGKTLDDLGKNRIK